ncbi:hypothetical protein EUX98_g5411 [Antrodiella citrinella]|uniref:Mug135-like C-terminal domain-containing protein n=1 Tax=Antrodiella citrinella TaxID=2447956 RepID=A0A4S4MSH8_9APHY|nr:hypothetical protein EUX98_g5411 [Antrodiella citrinella]
MVNFQQPVIPNVTYPALSDPPSAKDHMVALTIARGVYDATAAGVGTAGDVLKATAYQRDVLDTVAPRQHADADLLRTMLETFKEELKVTWTDDLKKVTDKIDESEVRVIARLAAVEDRLNEKIEASEERLTTSIANVDGHVCGVRVAVARASNLQRNIGELVNYMIVPNEKGEMPLGNQPVLINHQSVEVLNERQARYYYKFYHGIAFVAPAGISVEARTTMMKSAIFKAIGGRPLIM